MVTLLPSDGNEDNEYRSQARRLVSNRRPYNKPLKFTSLLTKVKAR